MSSTRKPQCWTSRRLGDLFKVKHGYAFKGKYFSSSGPYIVLTPGNFHEQGGFRLKNKEKYYIGDFPSEHILERGDLLVVMTEQASGLLGSPALIPESGLFLHNQRLGLIIELRDSKIDKRFLYYLFNTYKVRSQISATASGTKVRHTSPSRIYEVEIPLPPLPTQRKIAAILSAYDDLIENNMRRIAILEEMAQLLYREWFARFRFPGHEDVEMVESALGPIPAGWEVERLEEICVLTMGQSPKSVFYNEDGEGLPFHQGVTDFGAWFPRTRIYCTQIKRLAEDGDILFSVRAPVGRINVADRRIVIGRGLSAICSKTRNQAFVLFQLKEKFQEEDSMGGGTIFKAVTKADMQGILLMIPSQELIAEFEQTADMILQQIKNLMYRNAILRTTRDLLLPRLISGEVDVTELEITV